jgi:hypothetical protein
VTTGISEDIPISPSDQEIDGVQTANVLLQVPKLNSFVPIRADQDRPAEESLEKNEHSTHVVCSKPSPPTCRTSIDEALSLRDAAGISDVEEPLEASVASKSEKTSDEISSIRSFIVPDITGSSDSDYAPSNSPGVFSDFGEGSVHTEHRYTIQQLVIIALVVADSFGMTTSQIIFWIAGYSSLFPVGKGSWEQDVRATLKSSADFKSTRILGVVDNKKLWNFATQKIYRQYAEEYRDYAAQSTPPTDTSDPMDNPVAHESNKRATGSSSVRKTGSNVARKSASSWSKSTPTKPKIMPAAQIASPSKAKDLQLSSTGEEYTELRLGSVSPTNKVIDCTPLECIKPRRPPETLNINTHALRVANYHDLPFVSHMSPIETMTDVEKARKIAEIKARPSRKSYFGEDHKLEHKRRYGLVDIHDEGGLWRSFKSKAGVIDKYRNADVDMERDGQTLRELFGLPEKTMPINVGNDIAFRDATMVYFAPQCSCSYIILTVHRSMVDYHDRESCIRSGRCSGISSVWTNKTL